MRTLRARILGLPLLPVRGISSTRSAALRTLAYYIIYLPQAASTRQVSGARGLPHEGFEWVRKAQTIEKSKKTYSHYAHAGKNNYNLLCYNLLNVLNYSYN